MTVFMLDADVEHFQGFTFKAQGWDKVARWFEGQPIADLWTPLKVDVLSRRLPAGDSPSLSEAIPVFSQRAVDVLGFLPKSGELLPLQYRAGVYYAYNVTLLSDCLDAERSLFDRLPSGSLYRIKRHVFDRDKLKGLMIFKLKESPALPVYVTDCFRDQIRKHRLTGFKFRKVWSDK